MDTEQIKKQSVIFKRARGNLLLVVAFTVINLILMAAGSNFYLLFSATVPGLVYIATWYSAVGLIAALAITAVYLVCYLLSKKYRVFILVAMILFAVDTAIFLFLLFEIMAAATFEFMFLVELAFHAWILFYLITGTVAWAKLRKVTAGELEAARESIENEEAKAALDETKSALDDVAPPSDDKEDNGE